MDYHTDYGGESIEMVTALSERSCLVDMKALNSRLVTDDSTKDESNESVVSS